MSNKSGTETVVVVVEDEAPIRMVVLDAFEDEGFEVFGAEHAQEAIAILNTVAARVHVLFTDVNMPGDMNGVQLAHHVSRHWPWIGLVITSGLEYPARSVLPQGTRFFPKPYDLARVTKHIRELPRSTPRASSA